LLLQLTGLGAAPQHTFHQWWSAFGAAPPLRDATADALLTSQLRRGTRAEKVARAAAAAVCRFARHVRKRVSAFV
jgi:hypothetical protein